MTAQSGLLQTWSHLHKSMKRSLKRLLAPGSRISDLRDLHLPALYCQMTDRGVYAASLLKIRLKTTYDDRLPLIIQGNAALLRLTVALMLDYVMDRYSSGVGYTALEVSLAEEDGWDYVHFTVGCAGVRKTEDDGSRTWFSQDEMQQLAARMGGYFLAERTSTEPRYTIAIPLIPGDPAKADQEDPDTAPVGLTRAKTGTLALVVDDNPISRTVGVSLLARHNIRAHAAERGRMALKKLADQRYDLIFMDYSLPGLNGVRTTAIARAKGILPTGLIVGLMDPGTDAAEQEKAAFFEAGMEEYLDKPLDSPSLNLLLRDLLPRMRKETDAAPVQADAPDAAAGERQDLLRSLSGVAGLNAARGLAHMGHSVEIYTGMLRRFTAELEAYIEPLLTLPLEGAWEEFAVRLHVLHEFFVGIGAEELAREAAELTAAADAGGEGATMPRIQGYCDDMMRLRAELVGLKTRDSQEVAERREQADAQAGPPTAPVDLAELAAQVDLAELARHVSRLHDACLSLRATEAQETADSLRRIALPAEIGERITAICTLVDALDYHEAQELCARLLATIAPPEDDAAR